MLENALDLKFFLIGLHLYFFVLFFYFMACIKHIFYNMIVIDDWFLIVTCLKFMIKYLLYWLEMNEKDADCTKSENQVLSNLY